MSSTFSGISTALNALMAQRAALTLTGQNIANANTVGYTRQRAELSAVSTSGRVGMMSGTTTDQNGGGVTISSIRRLADAFVDARQRDAHSRLAYADAQVGSLGQVESILAEPSENGLGHQLTEFWNSWQGVSNNPGSVPARQALLSKATTIVGTLQSGRAAVDAAYTDTRAQLDALTAQVNITAQGVAQLNDQIRQVGAGGNSPNELIDQRDQLVLQLSSMVGARSTPVSDGTVNVSVNGVGIVSGTRWSTLSVAGANTIDSQATNSLALTWSNGSNAALSGGTLAGVVDSLRSIYPDVAAGYDQVAGALASSVNALHSTAQDLDGNATGAFFTGTTAKSLAVALTDGRQVGAAKLVAGPTPTPTLDSSIADQIAQLATSSAGADTRWSSFVAATGVISAAAQNQVSVHSAISQQADANRASASGVSIDEEMSNMLMFQRAYEGAARVMTSVDEMLDTVINRMGQVGR